MNSENQNFLNTIYDTIIKFLEGGMGDFAGATMFAVLGFIILFFRSSFLKVFRLLFSFRERRYLIPKYLRAYKESLNNETLKLNHSWKLEDQSMNDILVPINFTKKINSERTYLSKYILEEYALNRNGRFVILGSAGSGKSVAMGVIARKIWEINSSNVLLPVLLSFSELKEVKNNEKLFEAIIVKSLERFQFERGKRSQKAEKFVQENLYTGNILLLLDGFDELEKSKRISISNFLNSYFQTHTQIPFILTSRTSVWDLVPNNLPSLNINELRIAEFTPLEIRMFVSQWQFSEGKSADRLADLIESKSYLKNVATNPLMLTIITFLYAQPKRILPDNRVKFYAECVDALFEKWDITKNVDRANQFETVDKVTILSNLAYEHITNSESTDEDISKEKVLEVITKSMKDLSRPIERREKMLNEIEQNAELLVNLPPDHYKFPHRTFMEYFAANYFYEKKSYKELLNLYESDKGKWNETLSLFCGLNTNEESSNKIFDFLIQKHKETQYSNEPDNFVFKILLESARINPDKADEILRISKGLLYEKTYPDVIENLGFISSNPNWAHSKKTKEILIQLLSNENLTNDEFQQIAVALTNVNDSELIEKIFEKVEELDLELIISKMGKSGEKFVLKLFNRLSSEKFMEVIDGLANAGRIEFLMKLMLKTHNKILAEEIGWKLVNKSNSNSFFFLIDRIDIPDVDKKLHEYINNEINFWGWNKNMDLSDLGIKNFFILSEFATRYLITKKISFESNIDFSQIHLILRYFITSLLVKKGKSFNKFNLLGFRHFNFLDVHFFREMWRKPNNKSDIHILFFIIGFSAILIFFPQKWYLGIFSIMVVIFIIGMAMGLRDVVMGGDKLEFSPDKSKDLLTAIDSRNIFIESSTAANLSISIIIAYIFYLNAINWFLILLFVASILFLIGGVLPFKFFHWFKSCEIIEKILQEKTFFEATNVEEETKD